MCLTSSAKFTRSIRRVAPDESRKGPTDPANSRDKHNINGHVHIHFEDVLGEPGFDGPTNSSDCVWLNAHNCYTCIKNIVYRFLSMVFAFPAALLYGCIACASSFCHIWILTPCHKSVSLMCCHGLRGLNSQFWHACVGPLTRACGEVFWPFRNRKIKDEGSKRKSNKVSFNKTVKYKTIPARSNKL